MLSKSMKLRKKTMGTGVFLLVLLIISGIVLLYRGHDAVALGREKKEGISRRGWKKTTTPACRRISARSTTRRTWRRRAMSKRRSTRLHGARLRMNFSTADAKKGTNDEICSCIVRMDSI